jgi:FK506-binding protein 2
MCIGEKRTLTIAPSYGYGDRSIGPIPAGSTLGKSPSLSGSWPDRLQLVRVTYLLPWTVFETELMGIEGVPKPESIVTKSATESPASSASQKVAEKVASAVSEAAEAVKTVVADTDDVQEHNEL